MKTFLKHIQLGMVAIYFFFYMAVLVVEKILRVVCWWTVAPVFCMGLIISDKLKIFKNYISETNKFKKKGHERLWIES